MKLMCCGSWALWADLGKRQDTGVNDAREITDEANHRLVNTPFLLKPGGTDKLPSPTRINSSVRLSVHTCRLGVQREMA